MVTQPPALRSTRLASAVRDMLRTLRMEPTKTDAPRDAATVLIMRRPDSTNIEMLFVRRAAKSPFMPGTWVFPGGRVDTADGPVGSDAAFRAAACRECSEEVGIELEPAALQWIDTWQTPSAEPRRYTARFFVTEVPCDVSYRACIDGHELTSSCWRTAGQMLAVWEKADADLPPPTLCLLHLLAHALPSELSCSSAGLSQPILPKYVTLDSVPTIVMPHDPHYSRLPGAGAPAPVRSTRFAKRLERRDNRWIPRT